jgi:hypothetical protein
MKARESSLSRKSFSRRAGANVVPTAPDRLLRGKGRGNGRATPRLKSSVLFEMYAKRVAQGLEQYITKILPSCRLDAAKKNM